MTSIEDIFVLNNITFQVRGVVGGFTTCAAHSFVFIVVKTYPLLVSGFEKHGTFILYGCISLLGKILNPLLRDFVI